MRGHMQMQRPVVMRNIGLVVVLLVSVIGTVAQQQSKTAEPIYIRCDTLIDGKSDQPRKNVVIEIRGDKIASVGASGVRASSNLTVITQHTCLPGLIDTHTHVLLQGDITAADYDEQLL